MADHEARWLELNLDAAKVALAASAGELATTQAAIADAQARIAGKGFPRLVVWMDICGL